MILNWKKDKKLIKNSLKIMTYVIFSQMLISAIGFLDVFMTSGYSQKDFSAIGIGAEIWFMFQAPIIAFSALFGILYAQYKSEKNNFTELAKINIFFSIILATFISLLLFFLGKDIVEIFFIKDNYNELQNVNSTEVKNIVVKYLKIVALGNLFATWAQHLINPVVMIGKPVYIFYMSIIALIINAIFNGILIYVVDLGTVGAGISTTISYLFEFIFAAFVIFKNHKIFNKIKRILKFDKQILKAIIKRFGIIISSMIMLISFVFTSILITIEYGVKMMQSLSIAYSISGIMFSIMPAIKKAVNILIGNKLGQNDFRLAKIYSKKIVQIVFLISIIFSAITTILAFTIPYVTIQNTELANNAKYVILIFAITLIAYSLQTYYSAILESGGKQLLPAIFNYWSVILIQIPLIILLGPWVANFSFVNMYLIQSLAIYAVVPFLYFAYRRNKWMINLNKEIKLTR